MFRWFLILLVLLAAVAGLTVGVVNADSVTLNLLTFELTLPLGALVLLSLASGILIGLALAWLLYYLPGRLKRTKSSRRNEKGTGLADRPNG